MEDLYRLDLPAATTISCSDDMTMRIGDFSLGNYTTTTEFHSSPCIGNSTLQFDSTGSDMSDFSLMKAQIANHPRYQNLLSAYIECQKIGAPPEMASLLEEIRRENNTTRSNSEIGADPELDEFMESYCEVVQRYKEELSKPFDEATTFFSNMESQLINLCKGELLITRTLDYRSDEAAETSEEELRSYSGGGGEAEAPEYQDSYGPGAGFPVLVPADEHDIKGMLMRKYSGYLSSLKKEFLKKRKKGKLPKDARTTLMDWWNSHYRWPYPTEEEKLKLSEETGLDQKQINNWFINQRKRHWKPSEDMRFTLLDGVRLGANNNINGESMFFNATTSD